MATRSSLGRGDRRPGRRLGLRHPHLKPHLLCRVAESSVYVGAGFRARGIGTALLRQQTAAADAGDLWTLQAAIFPENTSSIALYHSAGFRTVGVREAIAQDSRSDRLGTWRDTVLLERRRPICRSS